MSGRLTQPFACNMSDGKSMLADIRPKCMNKLFPDLQLLNKKKSFNTFKYKFMRDLRSDFPDNS